MRYLKKDEFVPYAPDDGKVRHNHTAHDCSGGSDSMVIERKPDGIYAKCFRCGAYGIHRERAARPFSGPSPVPKGKVLLPSDLVLDTASWPSAARLWYLRAGIKKVEVESAGIGYSPWLNRIIIPCYDETGLVGYQARRVYDEDGGPKYYTKTDRTEHMLFTSGSSDTVVLCEDALSAIKCGRHCRSIACLGTELSDYILYTILDSNPKRVIVFMDYDNSIVIKKSVDILRRLSTLFDDVTFISAGTDPKNISDEQLRELIYPS